jgi:hypothetical protein
MIIQKTFNSYFSANQYLQGKGFRLMATYNSGDTFKLYRKGAKILQLQSNRLEYDYTKYILKTYTV